MKVKVSRCATSRRKPRIGECYYYPEYPVDVYQRIDDDFGRKIFGSGAWICGVCLTDGRLSWDGEHSADAIRVVEPIAPIIFREVQE